MEPKFSVVVIGRNEEFTLPRLLHSLKEFRERGGEVVYVDTGSTDKTAEIARNFSGVRVEEAGDRFRRELSEKEVVMINQLFVDKKEESIAALGDSLFDYSAARNYAASLAKNDMVAMPDCDEIYTKLNIDAIDAFIAQGVEQLEYNFVFAHDEEGHEMVKFLHSKFYDRRKLHWTGIIHEVLTGEAKRQFFAEDLIKLEHWQNPETNRGGYLKGLALDCYLNPHNDRHIHYFGRELLYAGRPLSAIKQLQRHIELGGWAPERSQSMVHMGEAYMMIGDVPKAIHSWIDAFDTCSDRREPLMKIAEYYRRAGSPQHVLSYTAAAIQIKPGNFYANFQPYYEAMPHELMYWALWELGEYNASKTHFDICMGYNPWKSEYLRDLRNYVKLPKMSIVIPTLRPDGLERLLKSIKKLNYPQDLIETIIMVDEPRLGVAKRLKEGVAKATGEWIVYAADDMEFEPDCLIAAFKQAWDNRKYFIAFNGGPVAPDEGNICEHFMIHTKLLPKINGEIFDTEFYHVGVDNLLWAQMKKLHEAMWCKRAKFIHHHFARGAPMDDVHKIGWKEERVKHDRELLAKKLEALKNNDQDTKTTI